MLQFITENGKKLLLKALSGETDIKFTKLKIGNGDATGIDISNLSDLISPLMEIPISKIERNDNNVVLYGAGYSNKDTAEDVEWNELGVYAEDTDGFEILYAVMNTDKIEIIKGFNSGINIENNISVMLLVSSDINVSAVIKSIQYATKEELDEHEKKKNPHGLTKNDIGLENVENKSISEQIPEFKKGQSLENIQVKDTIKTIISKLWALINAFSKHIEKENPHNITIENIGAASSEAEKLYDYTSSIALTSNATNLYGHKLYVKNGIAMLDITFIPTIKLTNSTENTVVAYISNKKARPISDKIVNVISSGGCQASVNIGASGYITIFSFGTLNIETNEHVRINAVYPTN